MERLLGGALSGGTQDGHHHAFDSDDAMEWMLASGADAGMTAAVGPIDELLGLAARA